LKLNLHCTGLDRFGDDNFVWRR